MSGTELEGLANEDIEKAPVPSSRPYEYGGHIALQTDIRGVTIRAKGNIVALGDCDNCSLESELGTVFLLYGSLQDTRIKAKINIYVKHSMQSRLEAGTDIVIEKHIMLSDLRAGRGVVSESPDARIVGGITIAGETIVVDAIGNENQVRTAVSVRRDTGAILCNRIYPQVSVSVGRVVKLFGEEHAGGTIRCRDGRLHFEGR